MPARIKVQGLEWSPQGAECTTDDIEVARRARAALLRTGRTTHSSLTLGEHDHYFYFGRALGGATQFFVVNRITLIFTGDPAYFMLNIGWNDQEGPFASYQEVLAYRRRITNICSIQPFLG